MTSSGQRLNGYKYFQSFEFKTHNDLSKFVRSITFIFVVINIIPNGKGGFVLFSNSDRQIRFKNANN